MKQTWLVAGLMTVIFTASALPAMAQSSSTSGASSFSAESILKRLPQLLGGKESLGTPTAAEQAEGADDVDQKIEKANDWFKTTTGLGLDELARAAWKLILWLIQHAVTWAWAIVAWLARTVGVETP